MISFVKYKGVIKTMENKQLKGLKRNAIDKFYTKTSTVDICIEHIKKNISIHPTDLIIEPSAGNGSFINSIKTLSQNTLFYDIEPEHIEIIQCDYLNCNNANLIRGGEADKKNWKFRFLEEAEAESKTEPKEFKKVHIIGNPPFGRQSSTAIRFIKKSCEFCDTISFILPKSFKKDSLKRCFSPYFHLIFEIDLPENSFLVDGKEYNVESLFQIWEKKDIKRPAISILEPINYRFVDKTANPDISFRRVGVYAGKIDIDVMDKSIQSHYFIQFTEILEPEKKYKMIDQLKKINFSHNNTVGPRSISKQEIIKAFNECIYSRNI